MNMVILGLIVLLFILKNDVAAYVDSFDAEDIPKEFQKVLGNK